MQNIKLNNTWRLEPSLTVTGRIVGAEGLLLVAATRADGTFVVEGVPPTDRFGNSTEFCFFGDFTQLDAKCTLQSAGKQFGPTRINGQGEENRSH